MDFMKEYEKWLASPALSADERAELEAIRNDPKEIETRFYGPLEFGTAGLRGTMAVGLHNMNVHVIRWATQGFCSVIAAEGEEGKRRGVAIAMDCRNHSMDFARAAAEVCAANGIHVRIFDALRPTPELSFAVREYGCQAGINVTASHNPKEYNGYKVYWEDGAQLPPHHADAIAKRLGEIDIFDDIKTMPYDEAVKAGLIEILGAETDEKFLSNVMAQVNDAETVAKVADSFKLVYTPFHGTGHKLIPEALKRLGIKHLICVPEQMVIDGNFPTVVSPNPENAEAMTLGMKMGTRLNADLVVATDPDADRLAIVCRDNKGEWMIINGNQTCAMFCYYIIRNKKALNQLQPTDFLVKTIVTTELVAKMAEKNHVELRDCYTGFKWIAREIAISEGKQKFIGGGEESFGFLPYDKVRDKDAPAAICLICEIAAWAKDNGMTLYDLLMQLYLEYGFSYEHTINVVKPGKTGADEIKAMMENFRTNPITCIAGSKVITAKDFQSLTQRDGEGHETAIDMPAKSNVLQYFCEDGTKVSVRPSGTEPKIKFYVEIKDNMQSAADYAACLDRAKAKVEEVKKSLGI